MPTEAEHVQKYAHNRAILDGPPPLSQASAPWAATVAFYAAVHLIEQLAAKDGMHHTRHTGQASRANYLANHPIHWAVAADFQALFSASMVARYETAQAFDQTYPGDVVQRQLIDGCLVMIESHVAAHV